MKTSTAAFIFTAVAGLAGCATNFAYEGKYARADGWREGTVLQIAPAGAIPRGSFRDCRTGADAASETPFVVVSFYRNSRYYTRITKLPVDAQLEVGDKVYVNIDDCTASLPRRNT